MAKQNLAKVETPDAPDITPMQMLEIAVEKGAELDQLQKLMDLQERWEKNEAEKAFVAALNAFKANPPELFKNRHVKFGQTEYNHATLDQVSGVIGKALSEHDISHRWDVTQDDKTKEIKVTCVLTHALGHSERVTIPGMPDDSGSKNSIQQTGSTITYLQRYTLLAATGLATKDQDDDGAASGEPQEKKWHGPLNKTKLNEAGKEFNTAMRAAKTTEEFKQVLVDHMEVTDQLQLDYPQWWHGDGGDIKGYRLEIQERRKALEYQEAEQRKD